MELVSGGVITFDGTTDSMILGSIYREHIGTFTVTADLSYANYEYEDDVESAYSTDVSVTITDPCTLTVIEPTETLMSMYYIFG